MMKFFYIVFLCLVLIWMLTMEDRLGVTQCPGKPPNVVTQYQENCPVVTRRASGQINA